ncbi:sushi, von Willebrand factor type A, EGF and pentraxin domain-containing protein 1-like [Pocillopora verrucosa]|uniref:sushi, von Willebrand factor type A, EGF and pentraxin domain-containing protein 1-like n=1 Tax=Pocillopora verrucosa TaxID=203993 RepID=UPI003341BFE7
MAFFFLSANLLALVVSASSVKTSKGQTPNVGFVFTNFLAHKGYYLNVTTVGAELVQDSLECVFKCLEKDPCLSFNLADLDDNIDNLLCELLPSDHYTHSDKFITNHLWYHYSIASPCSRLPCQNNGTCVPLYRTNSYKCRCTKAYTGSHCENVDNDCSCSSGLEGKQRCKIEYLMVFPELRSTENYAMKNPAITSDLSQLSLCFFIKLVQDQGLQNVVSYARERGNDMILEIHPTLGVFTVGNKKIQ